MSPDISKCCSDFLRAPYNSLRDDKLKASHARELVAAFFGYKSHAALLTDKKYSLNRLEEASVLVPDIPMLDKRRSSLNGLPEYLPNSKDLASNLASYLQQEGYFGGDTWLYESIENYVMEQLLIDNSYLIDDGLSGVMAETNAYFDETYYESATSVDDSDTLTVTVKGTYNGTSDDNKPFCGDQIDMLVTVELYRVAGRVGFYDPDISIGGSVNDDWVDPELKYGNISSLRPKEQFLAMTGGFRIDETTDQFQQRQNQIQAIHRKISEKTATVNDIDELSSLLGTEEDEF